MPTTSSPWLDAHRKLVNVGHATIPVRELHDLLKDCRRLPPSMSDQEFIVELVDRRLLIPEGVDGYKVVRRMVVHYKIDPYDVFIGRGSPWGNPFIVGVDGNRLEVIDKYREMVVGDPAMVARIQRELRGKVLGCYCSPLPCHGDVLVEIANQGEET
jgi:hypothetical protein